MNTIELLWENWRDPCVLIMEQFGLPGKKYTTEVTSESIKIYFKSAEDAFMCRLLISEYQ